MASFLLSAKPAGQNKQHTQQLKKQNSPTVINIIDATHPASFGFDAHVKRVVELLVELLNVGAYDIGVSVGSLVVLVVVMVVMVVILLKVMFWALALITTSANTSNRMFIVVIFVFDTCKNR